LTFLTVTIPFNYKADVEKLSSYPHLEEKNIDLVLCIESMHCFGNLVQALRQVKDTMNPFGSFVIADIFSKKDV